MTRNSLRIWGICFLAGASFGLGPSPAGSVQGERDYQVTPEDYHNWKTGLEGVPGAAFKLYPTRNHLFMPGRARSRPAEYQRHGNVLEEVIEDIAAWIKTGQVRESK